MNHFFVETFASPVGTMVLLTDADEVARALDWEDHTARINALLRLQYGTVRMEPRGGVSPLRRAVEGYFAGDFAALDRLPVKTAGTVFQREVWSALRTIPTGATTTYGRLAVEIGRPTAVRAVGAANGSNPISLIVPCHRVIGANASLTGYGGGIERKRWLLRHEGAALIDKL